MLLTFRPSKAYAENVFLETAQIAKNTAQLLSIFTRHNTCP